MRPLSECSSFSTSGHCRFRAQLPSSPAKAGVWLAPFSLVAALISGRKNATKIPSIPPPRGRELLFLSTDGWPYCSAFFKRHLVLILSKLIFSVIEQSGCVTKLSIINYDNKYTNHKKKLLETF